MLSLAKLPVLELFGRAGFFGGHLMGDLRSSCARQAYRAAGSAVPRVPCSQADRGQPLEQVDLGFLPIYGINPNAHRGVAAGDVGRVGCSYGY